jgi:GDP-L-fucose synthase
MKIAILGSRGFVGRNISNYLDINHTVTNVTRDTLDLLDQNAVNQFLKENLFDVVINCAAVMTNNETLYDTYNNLGMFMNFYKNSNLFGKFINTGSGAEFDRSTSIDSASEIEIFSHLPTDSYGFGQNIKSRLCFEKDNFYTIRIFNCFGQGEKETRLFPRLLSNQKITIHDRYFDYFSISDLLTVVDHCIENSWEDHDINAVYTEKYKISEIVKKFCNLQNIEPNFTIIPSNNDNYTGNGKKLQSMKLNLKGLRNGLKEYNKKE